MVVPSVIYWSKEVDREREDVLKEICFKLSVFNQLSDGVEELKKNHYDVIIISSAYDQKEAIGFLQKVKKRHKNTPVIIHSENYNNRELLLKEGATDVVIDELFNKHSLKHILLSVIRSADLDRQKRESGIQLKKLEKRLSTIVGNTPVILFMLDHQGVFKMGLGKLWERFKVNKQFVLGQSLMEVYDEYPAFVDAFNVAMGGDVQSISISINDIIFEIILTPVLDNKGEVKEVLGLAHDVTQRARSEMSLLKAKKLAENAAKIKQEFIANMSHEIRTPMNAIVGFVSLLEETSLNEIQKDYVQSVKISGENLLSLINTILDFSKIESGKANHENEVFDLNHVINSIDKVLWIKVKEKKLDLRLEVDDEVPIELLGDANRLYQILSNLLANSVKFTESGFVSLKVNCASIEENIANLQFVVEDTGIGIPEFMIGKVFDSFTQVTPESNRKYGGTGLGLSIVKKIVSQLKGSISLKSQVNKGTEFTVNIPFKIADDFDERKLEIEKPIRDLKLPKGLRILLAEDNIMNQKLVLMIMKKFDVQVDLAETGVEVIKALKVNTYDVVLMDIQMPEMDGIEATKIIRKEFGEEKKNIPILAMTAHAFQEELDKCLLVGMNDHVIKPIDTEDFINKMNKCLEGEVVKLSIDLSYLRKLFDNDMDMIKEVLATFEEEMPEILMSLQDGIDNQDTIQTERMAHKAKTSFKMLGMHKVVESLIKIEQYSKEGQIFKIQEYKDFTVSQYKRAIEMLKSGEML